jgi:5-methylcytosine-specific restriction endonuclease McrA
MVVEEKLCTKCNKVKLLSEFNKNASKPLGVQVHCRECTKKHSKFKYETDPHYREIINAHNKKNFLDTRVWIISYLKEHPCVICGESDVVVLEFDHLDPSDKKTDISSLTTYSISTIKKEIEKCQVLCGNCHRRKTAKQFGWLKSNGN